MLEIMQASQQNKKLRFVAFVTARPAACFESDAQ